MNLPVRTLLLCSLPCLVLAFAGSAGAQVADPEDTQPGVADPAADAPGEPPRASSDPSSEPSSEQVDGQAGPQPSDVASDGSADDALSELEREQALAEEAEARERDANAEEEDDGGSLDHELQLGIRAGAGVPFVFALEYGGGAPCGRDGGTFCVFVGSGIVDLDISFGVTPDLEITTMARIGMTGVEPTETSTLMFGLGIRSYVSPESVVKGFFGARVIVDITDGGTVMNWNDVDFGVRGEAGLQVDIVRYVGLYVQAAVNILVLRAFAISLDATGGLQIRFP